MQILNQENFNSLQPNNCSLDFALVFFVFFCLCTCLFRVLVLAFVLRFVFVRAFGNVLLGLYVDVLCVQLVMSCYQRGL